MTTLPTHAPLWTEIEFAWETIPTNKPYETEVELQLRHENGLELTRPAFWDGGGVWRVRFAF